MDSSCRPSCFRLLMVPLLAAALSACGGKKPAAAGPVIPAELGSNQLAGLAAPVYQAEAASAIHWQPWTRGTFERAREAQRLLFVVVVLPQQPSFRKVIDVLEAHPDIVATLNGSYVPVLVDGDAIREVGLLTAQLTAERKQPLDLPMFIWMTPDGNPYTWEPVEKKSREGILGLFNQVATKVGRLWLDDPVHILRESQAENDQRILAYRDNEDAAQADEGQPSGALQAARNLQALYDPYTRMIDGAGGLLPVGVMDVLSAAPLLPGVPEKQRGNSREILGEILEDMLPAAVFDPLEGGVFAGRVSPSWALPNFVINCQDQGRLAALMLRAHSILRNPLLVERSLSLIDFAERRCRTPEGLFTVGPFYDAAPESWLWHVEDIEKNLPAEDAKWWIAATGMTPMGNLPSESDPKREFFRLNSLSLAKPLEETAARLGVPAPEFSARFTKSRDKLISVRNDRLKADLPDHSPHAVSTLRMISAYAAAYTATGDAVWRTKAVELLELWKKTFYQDKRIRLADGPSGTPADARAFVYALAIQASQDVADITLDGEADGWITGLAEVSKELFSRDGVTLEVPEDAAILKLPVHDRLKVFDDSTSGVMALAAVRQSTVGGPATGPLKAMAAGLPEMAVTQPLIATDRIFAALVRDHSRAVVYGKDLPAGMAEAVSRLPLQIVPRGPAKDSDGIPAGSVRVISPDGSSELVSDPGDLAAKVLPR